METLLEVKNLTKDFGTFRAVDKVSFSIDRGKIVGLLGPNGAGKTTTIHMLLGIVLPTSGTISYFGKNFESARAEILQKINYVSAYDTLQGRISVWENLIVYANLYQVPNYREKINKLTRFFEIESLLNSRYWDLSSGQQTRVNLIKSFLNEPELILMDEPTASLDPDIADKTLIFIEEERKKSGISILYTSHNMEEVTRICDEVIFLDHGKIFAQDTPLGLTKRIEEATLNLTFDGARDSVENFLNDGNHEFEFTHRYSVRIKTREKQIPKIIFGLSEKGVSITDIDVKKPTLEDFFLHTARGGSE